MTLFSYVVDHDYGFAPNPYEGICVLSLCKFKDPQKTHGHSGIQDIARVGDWIIGTGGVSNESSGHDTLIYAMRVTEILPYQKYLQSEQFQLKKASGYGFEAADQAFANVPVLISDDFYYFGCLRQTLPPQFQRMQKKQGFKEFHGDDPIMLNFIEWLRKLFSRSGMIGNPCAPSAKINLP